LTLNGYKLPENLRKEFKIAYGEIYLSVADAIKFLQNKTIISVGDRISYNVINAGLKPKVIIFDKLENKTSTSLKMRSVLETYDGKTIYVKNPPGCVTEELWNAVKQGLSLHIPVKIMVDGEEDMAFLPAILEAEENDVILYGFFDKGFVLTNVSNDLKKKFKKLLSQMEELGS